MVYRVENIVETDSIWINARIAGRGEDIYLLSVKEGLIQTVCLQRNIDLSALYKAASAVSIYDAEHALLTPGLIDCHTHLVFAGNRAGEFERRLRGDSYEMIARQGGGILATVDATRKSSLSELVSLAKPRLQALMAEGVTTLEIKSGYGLELETELKMLRTARELASQYPIRIRTSFLGAHALPPEYQYDSDAYIAYVCEEMIPAVAAEKLADAVDVFCEGIGFSVEQCERVFHSAAQHGLSVKGHTEQLSRQGGTELVARYQGLSADHLEYLDEQGVRAMADAGAVAVLLPGAFYFLRESQCPPVNLLRQYGVPIALATDFNPGSSPLASIRLMMNMGCILFGLTPEETLAGVTLHAAKALGLAGQVGAIESGMNADFCLWDITDPSELSYIVGPESLKQRVFAGKPY